MLLALFVSVLVPVLSEWISDEDLCYLDTAVCSHKLRSIFLSTLEKCSLLNTKIPRLSTYKSWISLRRLNLKSLWLQDFKICELKELLKNNHLVSVKSLDIEELLQFFNHTNTSSDEVRLLSDHTRFDIKSLTSIGPLITDLSFDGRHAESVAILCPNLKCVKLPVEIDFMPFIECCHQLEVICHGHDIFNGDKYTYAYDLKKTNVVDEATLCFGEEEQYFNLTGLYAYTNWNDEDYQFLSLLVKHLTKVSFDVQASSVQLIATKCNNLTSLEAPTFSFQSDLVALVKQSSKLRDVKVFDNKFAAADGDPLVTALSDNCPQLEKFFFKGATVTQEVLLRLFNNCTMLRDFSYRCTGGNGIDLMSRTDFHSDQRGLTLHVDTRETQQVAELKLQRFSRMRILIKKILIHSDDPSYLDFIVRSHPQLMSLTLQSCGTSNGSDLSSVGCLEYLTSLSLLYFGEGFIWTNMFRNKNRLKTLVLEQSCTNDMLIQIRDSCPSLTKIDLTGCSQITNESVVLLLQKCNKLEHVLLRGCLLITADIFAGTFSPSLRCLNVNQT